MTILDERDVPADQIDATIHSHRVTSPEHEDQTVAFIWASDQGDEPPNYAGIWLFNKKGKREFRSMFDPNLDPLLFPLLFPRGTQGYKSNHYLLKKTKHAN